MLLLKTAELKVGRVTVKARKTAGREGFLMFFNAAGPDRFFFANYGANGNEFSALQDRGAPEGLTFRGGRSTRGPIENNRWYDLALVVKNNSAEMFLDGKTISTASVDFLPAFFSNAGFDQKTNEVILKATNYYPTTLTAQITLDGAATIGPSGKLITLQNDSPTTDNNFQNPHRITPREFPLPTPSPNISVQLPPYSVNILRIPAKP